MRDPRSWVNRSFHLHSEQNGLSTEIRRRITCPVLGRFDLAIDLHLTSHATKVACMTPLQAAALAAELLARMDRLSVLDLHPVDNAADLEEMRAGAEAVARDVLGYLLSSDNFVPVTEDDDAVQEWELVR